MKPIILLDINGVLNPKLQPGDKFDGKNVQLSDLKVALVRRLATKGWLAWILNQTNSQPPEKILLPQG